MGKKIGNDYRLWIESSTPGTYYEVAGQISHDINRSTAKIDTSTKDSGRYGTAAAGQRDLELTGELFPDLPDANGYTRLETLMNATTPAAFNVQIRKDGSSGDGSDVVFACSMNGGNWNTSAANNSAIKVTYSLWPDDAPTTDTLA